MKACEQKRDEREDTKFSKVDGRWYITKRLITQDGGLPPAYIDTYKPR